MSQALVPYSPIYRHITVMLRVPTRQCHLQAMYEKNSFTNNIDNQLDATVTVY